VPSTLTWTNSVNAAIRATKQSLGRFFATLARTDFVPPGDASSYRKSREAVDAAVTNQKPAPQNDVARLEKAQKVARAALGLPKNLNGASDVSVNSLTLLYHPLVNGWVGFALESNGQVHMARLPPFDKEARAAVETGSHSAALSKILLEPFAEPIRRAKRLRIPAHGRLRRVPFEALPWEGRVLADSVAVTYGFDGAGVMDRDVDPSLKCKTQPGALVVTNPGGDLPGAKNASARVQNALLSHGWSVRVLEGVAATRENTLAQLQDPCTALFHYDGHAKFDGRDGLRAALVLHDGTLTVTDILDLPRVPQSVALLGCATGKDEGLGLAQAFLVRGSQEVLAAMEDVDDRLSQRLAEGLYEDGVLATEGPPSLTSALQVSSAALRSTATKADAWWLFRVFSR
jgi:CHAT domain-containing protein